MSCSIYKIRLGRYVDGSSDIIWWKKKDLKIEGKKAQMDDKHQNF